MKVLHVIPTLAPGYGGPSHAIIGMTRSLLDPGVQVTIATTHDEAEQPLQPSGAVSVMSFPRSAIGLLPASFAYSRDLKDWLEKSVAQFDLVHVHTLFNYPSSTACAMARRKRVPCVVRPCGMLDPWSLRRSRWKKAVWMALRGRKDLNRAAALHFTSSEEQKLTDPLRLAAPGVVIPLGVEVPGRNRPEPASGTKVVLFLSRLNPKKGLDLLIPALGDLASRRDDFLFVLAGDGEARHKREIAQLVSENGIHVRTMLAGPVHGPDKSALLSRADIFVLPSHQENFGLVVAEAMAAGIPVVISDRVNIHPDVTHYRAGLVTTLNRREIAGAIETLLKDETLRREMGSNGQRLVREKFAWGGIGLQLAALYESVLARTITANQETKGRRGVRPEPQLQVNPH